MKRVRFEFQMLLVVTTIAVVASAAPFDLTVEAIKDSSSLLEKIKQPEDPLYSYFNNGKAPSTRADLIAVINSRILPNPGFAYAATKLAEVQTSDRFEDLNADKKEELLVKNRDLLTELYPDEIAPRNNESIMQSFGIKLPIKQADSTIWLKAEISHFLNEIIGNEKIFGKWQNLKQFFDESVTDKEVEAFTEELRTYDKLKIPVNSITIRQRKHGNEADVMLRGKNDKADKKLFTVSTIPGKKWRIMQVKNFNSDLRQAGYIAKKEVRQ